MTEFIKRSNISIVTAILPIARVAQVIDGLFELGEQNTLLLNARGTLIRDRWYQHFIPVISPELEFLQFLVPDAQVDNMIECVAINGQLQQSGAGAVFSVPCDEVEYGSEFSLWASLDEGPGEFNASTNLKENLTAIFCIAQSDQVDAISRAAMQAGAHGPAIYYCEGRGLRDRLGWLKITKKGVKEVITVIVDNADKIAVTEAMIEAGRLDMPGRGFLYRMPVQKGLINLPTMVGNRGNSANLKQIVAAIDSIKGSADWRDQSVIELGSAGKGAGLKLFDRFRKREWLTGQACLGCIVSRKHTDILLDAMLSAGASGANVSFARFVEAECETTAAGTRLNHESGIIRCILDKSLVSEVTAAIKRVCVTQDINDAFIFNQPVKRAFTYTAAAQGVK
ncbi:MAG: hypothetical protein WBN40_01835, partial [Pseudomonadales bacterium]